MSSRNTSNLYGLIFVGLLTASFSGLFVDNAEAKTMSIWERQKALMADINRGQKSKQLTVDEAKGLRQDLAAIARKKAKMLRDNEDGELTSNNVIDLEESLNNVSVDIKKLRLEKRVKVLEKKQEKEGGKRPWWKKL